MCRVFKQSVAKKVLGCELQKWISFCLDFRVGKVTTVGVVFKVLIERIFRLKKYRRSVGNLQACGANISLLSAHCIALVLFPFFSWGAAEFLPKTVTSEERLALHAQLMSKFPWFDNSLNSNYPFRAEYMDDLLDNEARHVKDYQKVDPDYLEKMNNKPGPHIFKVEVLTAAEKHFRELTPEGENYLKREFLKIYEEISKDASTSQKSLVELLQSQISSKVPDSNPSPAAIMTAIGTTLDGPDKEAFFSAGSIEEQIHRLDSERITVESDRLSKKINRERLGLGPNQKLTLKALMKTVKKSLKNQNRWVQMVLAQWVLKRDLDRGLSLAVAADTGERASVVSYLNQIDFQDLHVSDILNGLSKSGASKLGLDGEQSVRASKTLKTVFQGFLKNEHLFTDSTVEVQNYEASYQIYEVHPYLGIARGCIGGDCSSSTQYKTRMLPYAPSEHVFYMFDMDMKPLAYMTAQLQTIDGGSHDGKKVLYIKDIQGAAIDYESTLAAIYSLHHARSLYGVDEIALPSSDALSNSAKELVRNLVWRLKERDKSGIEMRVHDQALREHLVGKDNTYDNPEIHSHSHLFIPKPEEELGFKIEDEEGTLGGFEPPSKSEATLMALRRLRINPEDGLEDLAALDYQDTVDLYSILQNEGREASEDYYKRVKESLEASGLSPSTRFFKKNEELFRKGHLLSSDAFADQESRVFQSSLRYLLSALKASEENPWLLTVLKENWQILEEQPAVQTYFEQMQSRTIDSKFVFRLLVLASSGSTSAAEIVAGIRKERLDKIMSEVLSTPSDWSGEFFVSQFFDHVDSAVAVLAKVSTSQLEGLLKNGLQNLGLESDLSLYPRIQRWFYQRSKLALDSLSQEQALRFKEEAAARAQAALPQNSMAKVVSHEDALWDLSNSDDLAVSIPGLHELVLNYENIQLPVEKLRQVAVALMNDDEELFSDSQLHLSEKAADILLSQVVTDRSVLNELIHSTLDEDDPMVRGKAALAYLWNQNPDEEDFRDNVIFGEFAVELRRELHQLEIRDYDSLTSRASDSDEAPPPPVTNPVLRRAIVDALYGLHNGAVVSERPIDMKHFLTEVEDAKTPEERRQCILD